MFEIDEQEKIKEYKDRDWRIVGHFCSYTPEELFYSCGILPIRIFAEVTGSFAQADKYFPAYTCSFGRTTLDALLSDKLDDYDGFFFSSNCDTIRHLHHHFQRKYPERYIPNFTIPAKVFSSNSESYILDELKTLERSIQTQLPGKHTSELGHAVGLYRRNRSLIREIAGIRLKNPERLPAATMNQIYRYNNWVDKEIANERLAEFIGILRDSQAQAPSKPRVYVLGNCCGNNGVVELIEKCGSHVVNDLLASGNKYFDDVDEQPTPMGSIAARLNRKIVCPTKHMTGFGERHNMYQTFIDQIKAAKVDGIVILNQKFCDPHGLDKPLFLPKVTELGIPMLELESEQDINNMGQLTNRLEAFFEIIG